jgi:ribosomal protein L36
MFCSGSKDKLAEIAAECKVLGSRPTYCPQCKNIKRFSENKILIFNLKLFILKIFIK